MIAIEVKDLFMKFNMAAEKTDSLKEYFVKLIKRQLFYKEFIALNDVSFSVKKGEAMGILGANGSGKSTLLKCISGIYPPTSGIISVSGTIAPMIELGAGFDPELTARENIFLNGAVMGFKREFIKEKFDEIVEFSELHNFLDVPVKNFSSGMGARLGFSISTLVKPDILIIDEILSVGDVAFQKKCTKKMEELRSEGTTLLFVSHSKEQISELCDRAIWLKQGVKVTEGNAIDICNEYADWANNHSAFENINYD